MAAMSMMIPAAGAAGRHPLPRLQMVNEGPHGISMEISAPPIAGDASAGLLPASGTNRGKIAFEEWDRPGDARLPVISFLVGTPPGAVVSVDAEPEEVTRLPLRSPLRRAPAYDIVWDRTGDVPVATGVLQEEPAPGGVLPFPQEWATAGKPAFIRQQQVVRITVFPYHPGADGASIRYASRIRLHITFEGGVPGTSGTDSDVFEKVLRAYLVDYAQAKEWRAPRRYASSPTSAESLSGTYRVQVNEDGIYRLTYSRLRAAGMSLKKVNPRMCRMAHGNTQIPIQIVGGEDGRFDPGDEIRFYGEAATGIYTDVNVYWLSCGEIEGKQMQQADGSPASAPEVTDFRETLHREENHFYVSSLPKGEGKDHWFWTFYRITSSGSILTRTFTADIASPVAGSYTATLKVNVQGGRDNHSVSPDHHLRMYVNGTPVGDAYWDGDTTYVGTFSFPQALLHPGSNEIKMAAPGDMGSAQEDGYINWFEIGYVRELRAQDDEMAFTAHGGGHYRYRIVGFSSPDVLLYDVTDPFDVKIVTGASVVPDGDGYALEFEYDSSGETRFLALDAGKIMEPISVSEDTPSSLRSPDNHADYIIIAHRDFWDAASRLAQFHRSQGLSVALVDVQDVYDEFSGGVFSAEAIREFLEYAYRYWRPPAPSYVLLFGDGSSDFRNYLGDSHPNYVPPLLRYVDPFIGETASDNRYVTIVGDDQIPDMLIGRLPVDTPAEADAVVDKIISYDTSPPAGDWRKKLLFVSDNPDSGGNFPLLSDQVISESVTSEYTVEKVYYGVTHPRLDAAKRDIKAGIDNGALIVNYVGHAAIPWWAAEMLFGVNDVPSLTNGSMLPVMLPMTCYEGSFHNPQYDALGEVDVRAAGKGAIASWSATGLGVAHGHDYLDRGFLNALFRDGITDLGGATLAGKLELYRGNSSGTFYDLLDTYVLLGDPYTHVALNDLPTTKAVYLPLVLHVEGTYAPTPTPTKRPKPTLTPTPTATKRPKQTYTPTPTPTKRPKPTPTP